MIAYGIQAIQPIINSQRKKGQGNIIPNIKRRKQFPQRLAVQSLYQIVLDNIVWVVKQKPVIKGIKINQPHQNHKQNNP